MKYATLQQEREKLCDDILKKCTTIKTPDWTIENLDKVIKYNLKDKISRDPDDNSNELIKQGGQDLKIAILAIMNNIKNQQIYPEVMKKVNISSICKNKGKRNNLNFYRGVFRVPF